MNFDMSRFKESQFPNNRIELLDHTSSKICAIPIGTSYICILHKLSLLFNLACVMFLILMHKIFNIFKWVDKVVFSVITTRIKLILLWGTLRYSYIISTWFFIPCQCPWMLSSCLVEWACLDIEGYGIPNRCPFFMNQIEPILCLKRLIWGICSQEFFCMSLSSSAPSCLFLTSRISESKIIMSIYKQYHKLLTCE